MRIENGALAQTPSPFARASAVVARPSASAVAACPPADEALYLHADESDETKWGARGHALINREAAQALPEDMPAFFREAGSALESLGPQPDRWKLPRLPNLDVMNRPDHYINYELLGTRPLPSQRYAYISMIENEHLALEGQPSYSVGLLPYGVAEYTEKLTAEFALWRHEVEHRGPESTLAQQLAQNAIYTAGILGHFVADASQPLHNTVHHDGWNTEVEPNPGGFRENPGLHSRFETQFLTVVVRPPDVEARLQPARVLEGTPLSLADAFCRETAGDVRTLYTLDRDGKLNPMQPSQEGHDFTVEAVANGAQFLRDLWYTAWTRSEALVADISDNPSDALPVVTPA